MHKAHFQVALVRCIEGGHFFVAFAYLVELPLRQVAVEPCHACPGGGAASRRQEDFKSLAHSFGDAVLPAIGQPQDSQGEDAIDGGHAFFGVHPDQGPALLPAHQKAPGIGGAEAVLQVHRGTQAFQFVLVEVTSEQAFEQPQIPGSAKLAGCRGSLLSISYDL